MIKMEKSNLRNYNIKEGNNVTPISISPIIIEESIRRKVIRRENIRIKRLRTKSRGEEAYKITPVFKIILFVAAFSMFGFLEHGVGNLLDIISRVGTSFLQVFMLFSLLLLFKYEFKNIKKEIQFIFKNLD